MGRTRQNGERVLHFPQRIAEAMDEIMGEVTGSNAFTMYDPIHHPYHMHSLFKQFLTNELKRCLCNMKFFDSIMLIGIAAIGTVKAISS